MSDLLDRAVRNNADWCSRICALHGSAGEFGAAAWVCERPTPLYYPNIVTLRADSAAAQTALAEGLAHLDTAGVKDSFNTLDLAPLGFRAAIQGRWIHHREAPSDDSGLDWRIIESVADLANWEAAWGGGSQPRIFLPAILADPTIRVFGGYAGGLLAGGIVSHAAGVAGLSNSFANDPAHLHGVMRHAHHLAEGAPVVGWEADDRWPGSVELGRLQVWLRDMALRRR